MTKPQAQTKPIRFIQAGRLRILHDVPPERTVLEVLREDLHQTGTKEGCGEGDCGACTVVLGELRDGQLHTRAVNSCIQMAHALDGMALWTVEDLAGADGPDDVVALKKINRHHLSDGFPKTETREVKILKALRHPNMVRLREVRRQQRSAAGRRTPPPPPPPPPLPPPPLPLPLDFSACRCCRYLPPARRSCRLLASRRRTTPRTAPRWLRPPPNAWRARPLRLPLVRRRTRLLRELLSCTN